MRLNATVRLEYLMFGADLVTGRPHALASWRASLVRERVIVLPTFQFNLLLRTFLAPRDQ